MVPSVGEVGRRRSAFGPFLPALFLAILLAGVAFPTAPAAGERCEDTVRGLNRRISPRIDEGELVTVLRTLSESRNRRLPEKFVTKRQARKMGWTPGRYLWDTPALRGRSIGGDRFENREGTLPGGGRKLREADLDYKGGRRGAKRLVFSGDGDRWVTVDHYRTFVEVPACR
jgi:hypothetical protein